MDSAIIANFEKSLEVMGFGMGGIFVVLITIYLMIKVLIKLFPEK